MESQAFSPRHNMDYPIIGHITFINDSLSVSKFQLFYTDKDGKEMFSSESETIHDDYDITISPRLLGVPDGS